MKHIHRILLH